MNPRFPGKFVFCAILVSISAFYGAPLSAEELVAPENPDIRGQCAEPSANRYRKSVAFASFPRTLPQSSSAGSLHQVDQQLPRLIAKQLGDRAATVTPVHLSGALPTAADAHASRVESQVQQLANQYRTQFVVSGEVRDMSLMFPGAAYTPGLYTRFINGVHNALHINTPLDKRYRIFSFQLELRDGFTGEVLFTNQYQTFGKWKATRPLDISFDSPRFWKSDYGVQIQHLVTRASDELATAINCQPHIARIDARPGQQEVIIHSGANNGLRAGDTLELYQLVTRQASGKYDIFDTRLISRQVGIVLTEVYPSHSVANVSDEVLLTGHYLALAP